MAQVRKDVEFPYDGFDVHDQDQLPSCEEIKLDAGYVPSDERKSSSTIKQAIMIALAVAILVLGLFFMTVTMTAPTKEDLTDGGTHLEDPQNAVVIQPKPGDPEAAAGPGGGSNPSLVTAAATTTPVPTPDPSLHQVFEILQTVSKYEELITPGTFQNRAASWIVNDHLGDYYLNNGYHDQLKERYILTVFFYAMSGEKWEEDLNFLSTKDICHWFGSKTFAGTWCDKNGRVVQLMFPENYLVGVLPSAELQHLSELQIVDFGNNPGIQGEFPIFLEKLSKLGYIGLQYCGLEGSIPEWVGSKTNLRTLVLSNNQLSGSLPPTNLLSNMEFLYLDDNSLKGDISDFSAMTKLKHLVIEDNDFSGRLDEIMHLSTLETLDISHNQIGSTIPSNIWKDLINLKVLDIHGNRFIGTLPGAVDGSIHSQLEFLAVNDNSFEGGIPSSLNYFTSLRHLDLSNNAFDSTLPDNLEGLTNIHYFFAAHNPLQAGEIPTFLRAMTDLVDLSLQNTNRVGTIPTWITGSSFHSLTLLDFGNNALESSIPDSIGAITSLQHLLLNRNNLHGNIPSKLSSLTTLLLDHNGLLDSLTENVCRSSPAAAAGSGAPNVFTADCGGVKPQVPCECCTLCCKPDDASCNSVSWNGDVDGIWEYSYRRRPGKEGYQFSKEEP